MSLDVFRYQVTICLYLFFFFFFAEGIPETFTIITTFKQKKVDLPQGTKKLKIPLLTIYNAEEAREIIGLYVGLRTMFLYSDNTIKNTKPVRFNFNTNDDRWEIYGYKITVIDVRHIIINMCKTN